MMMPADHVYEVFKIVGKPCAVFHEFGAVTFNNGALQKYGLLGEDLDPFLASLFSPAPEKS